MGIQIISGASSDVASVDTNKNLQVNTPTTPANAGFAKIASVSSRGVDVRNNAPGSMNRLLVGIDEILWYNPVEGATIDSNLMAGTAVTMTVAQALASGITLNNSAITTANTNVRLSSVKTVAYTSDKPLVARWQFKRPSGQTGQANETIEMGMFNATVATAPTDGLFFRWNNAGNFVAVSCFNSTETQSATLTSPTANVWHTAAIVSRVRDTEFYVDDVLVATVTAGAGDPGVFSTQRVSMSYRVYVGASTPATAPQLLLGKMGFWEEGAGGRDRETVLVQYHRGSTQSPTSTSNFGQTANHANSTSPTSATLSNTAAGYTTLGGRYQFAAPAGAVTDFALFGFQVPVGFQLMIQSVAITAMNTGAAVATTATILDWSLGLNASAVSLATADALGPPATAWAPRRVPIGMQGFPLAAPRGPAQIGDSASDIIRTFNPPLVIDSGRFVHVIVQVPVGTATASQVIRGDVMISGWFE
jgi:hypothetical protein